METKDPKNDKLQAEKYPDEENLASKVKLFFTEWLDGFTMHGFANINRTENIIFKVAWALLIVGLIGYCIYLTDVTIRTYLQYNTFVSIRKVRVKRTEFPAVTICNLNAFDVASHSYSGWYLNKVLQERSIPADLVPRNDQDAIELIEDVHEVLKAAIVSDHNLTTAHLKNIGFKIETMLVSCYFDGTKCSTSDFTWFYSYRYGNCYTFNAALNDAGVEKAASYTSKYGPGSGLVLELFTGAPGKQNFFLVYKGIYLQINNRTDRPFVKYSGIILPTGKASNVEVSKEVMNGAPAPYSDCRKDLQPLPSDSIYYKYTANITKYYQHLCIDIYFQTTLVLPKCGCYEANSPIYDKNLVICKTIQEIECAKRQIKYMNTPVPVEDCPKECDYTNFKTSVSSADYPTDYYAKMLRAQSKIRDRFSYQVRFNPYDGEETTTASDTTASPTSEEITVAMIEASMAKIKVHLDALEYTSIEETPAFTVDSLIGAMGGIFGLFVGGSICSFIEVLYMLFSVGIISFRHVQAKRARVSSSGEFKNDISLQSV